MITFLYHDGFKKEIAAFERRFRKVRSGLIYFERLCQVQFNPSNPKSIVAPAKLHRITQNDVWTMWKIELAVEGLRSNQFPRVWFAVQGATIVFLCMATHIDNYNDGVKGGLALSRVSDIL